MSWPGYQRGELIVRPACELDLPVRAGNPNESMSRMHAFQAAGCESGENRTRQHQ
jgi:hypothetical protein